ncbi:MAG: purine-nucleoside phosphorylase, partial [Flavobacteriales bacterium]|nr:purine-nucleoside phosphorylase [Flavobacteriales bacterium]
MEVLEELSETVSYLRDRGVGQVDCSIVLGTGLGDLIQHIEPSVTLNYSQIPHLPVATLEFHFGKLIYGKLGGKWVLAWQGRFHYYEGYSMEQVVKPVRIAGMLGARAMFISN